MKDVSGQGRTVLFVSHNMSAVKNLCARGIVLKNGSVDSEGNIEEVLARYNVPDNVDVNLDQITNRMGAGEIRFTQIHISSDTKSKDLKSGSKMIIELFYAAAEIDPEAKYEFVFGVWNSLGTPMFMLTNSYLQKKISLNEKTGKITYVIPSLPLNTGIYNVNLLVKKNNVDMDFIENAFQFKVDDGNFYNTPVFYPSSYEGIYTGFELID